MRSINDNQILLFLSATCAILNLRKLQKSSTRRSRAPVLYVVDLFMLSDCNRKASSFCLAQSYQMPREYTCNCEVRCHGGKPVSRATYNRHAPYRHQLHPLSNNFDASDSEDDIADSDASEPEIADYSHDTGGNFQENNGAESPPRKKQKIDDDTADFLDDFDDLLPINQLEGDRSSPEPFESDLGDPGCLDDPGCLEPEEDEEDKNSTPDIGLLDNQEAAEDADPVTSSIAELQTTLDFIQAVKDASLDNGDLDDETLALLRDPPTEPLDVSDPALRYSLDLFKATTHGSIAAYNESCIAYKRRHPTEEVLRHAAIKKKVQEWSSFATRDECLCGKPRLDDTGSAKIFYTFPIGPQLQALFRSPESAKNMHYRREKTKEILEMVDEDGSLNIPVYEDFIHGQDYLDAVIREAIQDTDVVLIGSIDGAQLYRNKKSDC
ncbi:hypothetical protein B0H13DRAFT_2350823 [Mycena leptocephala]|nr:hypothetical protein B0H13DRAFT_2350823 [Mycena leptocephala]